jgi:hypothetical protein
VLVADLLGHSDLGTLKLSTQPNDVNRERALALLTTDARFSSAVRLEDCHLA